MKKLALLLMILLFLVVVPGCGGDVEEEANVEFYIGTKNTTEQDLLAEIARQLINIKSDHQANIVRAEYDSSKTLLEKIKQDEIQIYFDYESTIYLSGFEKSREDAPIQTLDVVVKDLLWEYSQLSIIADVGYDGGMSAFLMPERYTELKDPANMTDIVTIAGLTIGMEESFYERTDGYAALKALYEFKGEEKVFATESEGFQALSRGEIDMMVGSTTSIYNYLFDLYLLNDDKGFFLPCRTYCIIQDDIRLNYPDVAAALEMMNELITAGTMSSLIEKVEQEGYTLEKTVEDFLLARNLISYT